MAQYNPQAQQGGGRGSNGRGYQGRGGSQSQGRPMGAWQPSAPTSSLQQAAYGRQPQQGGYHPQQHHHNQHLQNQPHQQHHHPQGGPPPLGSPSPLGGPPFHAVNAAPHHYNPYAQQAPFRGGQAPGGWQPAGYPPHQGGVYYPPASAVHPVATPGPSTSVVQPPKREKKPLVITDKNGNVLDFRFEAAQKKSSLKAAVTVGNASDDNSAASKDAGAMLREAALARLKKKESPADGSAKKPEEPAGDQLEEDKSQAAVPAPESPQSTLLPPERKPTEALETPPGPEPAKEEKQEKPLKPSTASQILPETAVSPASTLAPAKPVLVSVPKSGCSSLAAAANKSPDITVVIAALAPQPSQPKASAGGLRPGGKTRSVAALNVIKGRIVYDKIALLRFKTTCMKKPDSLPDMTIVKGPAKQQSGSGGGGGRGGRRDGGSSGGGSWDRGNQHPPRRNSQNNNSRGDSWARGQEPPKNRVGNNRGGRRGSQSNGNQPLLLDGPVAPLKKSENRWKPSKNTSPLQAAEKQVKGILNKMTKEKFDRLSAQMCEIQILSYDMLTMMIHNVYEKAIDEPSFGDMYADLCVKLSKGAAQANNDFVKLIESDEEPPNEGDSSPAPLQAAESSSHIVYRWSNDVSTTDREIVGPFPNADACMKAALESSGEPISRGETKLELVQLRIKQGTFIKVTKKQDAGPDDGDIFYAVYFKVDEAEECGQQLSEIFLSEVECISNAKKKNSFKRSLLNKCEDEFKKQDIYVDWKKEKKEYEESKTKLTVAEQAEREEELDFRRIKIKKQMLGNIKFIGQLYKKGLLKEKIMRFCIGSLLKLDELVEVKSKNPEYKDSGDMDMDEEDHEAICSMFTTIGSTIDRTPAADFMNVCFTKIQKLSVDKKNLPARSRFMYKDLLELRENNWVPRRDEGKAKTLEEIRKDVELEEKRQAQQSAQNYRNDRGGRGQQGGYDNRRGGNFGGGRGGGGGGNRNRPSAKTQQETDDDGFTVIARGTKGHFHVGGGGGGGCNSSSGSGQRSSQSKQSSMPKSNSKANLGPSEEKKPPLVISPAEAPLSPDKLERRIKSMRAEYMQDPSNQDELLLLMDELSGTKDAGFTLVLKSADAMLDCKEAERKAIIEVVLILYENGKLSKDDIRNGLADFIEFIDSMIMDCPKLFDYMGDMLAVLFIKGAVDVQWYCDTLEKTKLEPDAIAPEMLTRATISSIRSRDGASAAKDLFGNHSGALNSLCGADKWKLISNDLLG